MATRKSPQKSTPKKDASEYKPRVWMKAFITVLSEQGNVSRACTSACIDRKTAYKARDTDSIFAQAWDEALEAAADVLEAEAWRRAVDGVEEPVGFYQGSASEYVRKYSDTLLMFLMKGARPAKYRENTKVEVDGQLGIHVVRAPAKMSREEWKQQADKLRQQE